MSQFQTVHNREQTRSMKWDDRTAIVSSGDVLSRWVADMDFKEPEAVNNALKERAEHGIYGYTVITDDIRTNVTNWISLKHGWDVETDWLSFSAGVITSLHIAI